MTIIAWLALTFVGLGLVLFVLTLISATPEQEPTIPEPLPFVSILISVRNEVDNLPVLLKGLANLDYPKDKMEVLIGDDASDDDTLQMLKASKLPFLQIHAFGEEETGSYGKQKVLKQLYPKVEGEVILFTDGDMILKPQWVKGMLVRPGVLKVGLTTVVAQGVFSALQNLDWLLSEWMIKWLADRGRPLTAWGNNMSAHRETLEAAGFLSIKETEVEDFALSQAVLRSGGSLEISSEPAVRLTTLPVAWRKLIFQRMRWMKGIAHIPFWVYLAMGLRLSFVPLVLYSAWIHPAFLLLLLLRPVFYSFFLLRIEGKAIKSNTCLAICLYDWYELLLYFSSFVSHIFKVRFDWKGRIYK